MKKTKRTKAGKRTLLSGAAKSLRRLGKGTSSKIGGLSTAQKVVGGAALVALGLNYLSKRRSKTTAPANTDAAAAAEENLSAMDANA